MKYQCDDKKNVKNWRPLCHFLTFESKKRDASFDGDMNTNEYNTKLTIHVPYIDEAAVIIIKKKSDRSFLFSIFLYHLQGV
jgi:hypothetical protein